MEMAMKMVFTQNKAKVPRTKWTQVNIGGVTYEICGSRGFGGFSVTTMGEVVSGFGPQNLGRMLR
jgi:hypothetical protein